MNEQNDIKQLKQAKNLFKKLIIDSKSVFYGVDKINKANLKNAKKSYYLKDNFFIKLYNNLDYINILYTDDNNKAINRIPFYAPFVKSKQILIVQHCTVLKHPRKFSPTL